MPMPPRIQACDEATWVMLNGSNYDWYYENYPLIQSGISLPVSFEALKIYYIQDMNERNFTPQMEWLECYDHVFSYLLGRIDGTISVRGTGWFDRMINAVPVALGRTYEQITSPFGVPLMVWLMAGLTAIVLIKK
jgi:hypothetical protein